MTSDLQQRAMRALAGGVSSNTRLLNPHLIVDRAAGLPDLGRRRHRVPRLPARPGAQRARLRAAAGAGEGAGRAAGRGHLRGHAPPGDRGGGTRAGRARLGRDDAVRQLQHGDGAGRAADGPGRHRPVPRRPVPRPLPRLAGQHLYEERGHGGRPGQPGPAGRRAARRPGAGVERHRGVRAADGHPRQRRGRRDHGADHAQRGRDRPGARLPGGGPADLHRSAARCSSSTRRSAASGSRSAAPRSVSACTRTWRCTARRWRPGWPCAAIAGRRDLFAGVASGAVTHAGTFNGNTIATAAVLAALDELESGEVYEQIGKVGTALMQSHPGLRRGQRAGAAHPGPADGVPRQLRATRPAPGDPVP